MKALLSFPIALALLAAPSAASDQQKPEDKIVCKRSETTSYTGSNLGRPKKTCRKASEWKEIEEEKNSTMRRIQDGRVSPNQPARLGNGGN